MDRGAWRATVHGVAKRWTGLKQLSIRTYIYPLFFGFPSHLGHHRALNRVPLYSKFSVSYLFYTQYQQHVCMEIPISQFILPTSPSALASQHLFCVSISNASFKLSLKLTRHNTGHIQVINKYVFIDLSAHFKNFNYRPLRSIVQH